MTDAELLCLAVAQVLLRYHDGHHWLRAVPARVGHLFASVVASAYNQRLKDAAPVLGPRCGGSPPGPRAAPSRCG